MKRKRKNKMKQKIKQRIELGDKVRCIYTGFEGIAVARTEFINGCIQISIAPKWDKKTNPVEQEMSLDSKSLKIIKKNPIKVKKEEYEEYEEDEEDEDDDEDATGGPISRGIKMRGY